MAETTRQVSQKRMVRRRAMRTKRLPKDGFWPASTRIGVSPGAERDAQQSPLQDALLSLRLDCAMSARLRRIKYVRRVHAAWLRTTSSKSGILRLRHDGVEPEACHAHTPSGSSLYCVKYDHFFL